MTIIPIAAGHTATHHHHHCAAHKFTSWREDGEDEEEKRQGYDVLKHPVEAPNQYIQNGNMHTRRTHNFSHHHRHIRPITLWRNRKENTIQTNKMDLLLQCYRCFSLSYRLFDTTIIWYLQYVVMGIKIRFFAGNWCWAITGLHIIIWDGCDIILLVWVVPSPKQWWWGIRWEYTTATRLSVFVLVSMMGWVLD